VQPAKSEKFCGRVSLGRKLFKTGYHRDTENAEK
jgi:hypothetical protein